MEHALWKLSHIKKHLSDKNSWGTLIELIARAVKQVFYGNYSEILKGEV